MVEVQWTADGIRELVGLAGPVGRMLLAKGQAVAQDAKQKAPVRTGKLRDSIGVEMLNDGHGVVARVEAKAPYALFVEVGTSDTPAEPFLRPAVQAVKR